MALSHRRLPSSTSQTLPSVYIALARCGPQESAEFGRGPVSGNGIESGLRMDGLLRAAKKHAPTMGWGAVEGLFLQPWAERNGRCASVHHASRTKALFVLRLPWKPVGGKCSPRREGSGQRGRRSKRAQVLVM